MAYLITREGKHGLQLETPVMTAAGTFGFGEVYRDNIELDRLGALVTHPVTYEPWSPATGTRVVPLPGGVLMHTGLPNPGLNKVLKQYRNLWRMLPVPVILHLVATNDDHVRKSAARLDEEETVEALELGLADDVTWQDVEALVKAARSRFEKPLLVRLPLSDREGIVDAAVEHGADALVVAAPPRGTASDPQTEQLVGGRVYGPLVKPLALRMVGQVARRMEEQATGVPVIGAGGIHSPLDAREFIKAGAKAVQVGSLTWIEPRTLELIARDLGGVIITRKAGAYSDEWNPFMTDTDRRESGAADPHDDPSRAGEG